MAFYPSVPEDDTKVERLLTLCSYYDKIYSEADKLYFEAERMDKLRMNAAINTIRGYDDKIYQLTGESLVGNQLSLLSYSYETAEEHNKILISSVERLSKIEMPPNQLWVVRDILADVRAAASRTTGIVSDFHTIVKGMRIKPYY